MTSLKFTDVVYLAAMSLVLGLIPSEFTRAESQLAGEALILDGDGDYVSAPSASELQNANAITLEAWMRPTTSSSGRIISKSDGISGTSARSYDLTYSGGAIRAEFFIGPPGTDRYVPLQTETVFAPGSWIHVAATFDGNVGAARLYVNGKLMRTRSKTTLGRSLSGQTLRQTAHPLTIGHTPPFETTYFNGDIEQVRVWSRALSPSEIRSTRTVPLPAAPGLEAAWLFDGGYVDAVGDHHATPHGDATTGSYDVDLCSEYEPNTLRVPADYATIQDALDAATHGDRIEVEAGTYVENLVFPPREIHLIATAGPQETTVDASSGVNLAGVTFLAGCSNASTLEGFTITGGTFPYGAGVYCQLGAEPSILGNHVIENHASYDAGGIFPRPENTLLIEGNLIGWNTAVGSAGGFQAPSSQSIVERNVVVGNSANYGGAYFARVESSVTLTGNTFIGNTSAHGSVASGDGGLVFKNCIVWDHGASPFFMYGGGSVDCVYSLVDGGTGQPWFGDGCIDADPLLVDIAASNFHLTTMSPCIDAGDPSSPADFDGTRADMGALSFHHVPAIKRIAPATGPELGGNTVLIHGTGFVPSTMVTIGGRAAVTVYLGFEQLEVIVPPFPIERFRVAAPRFPWHSALRNGAVTVDVAANNGFDEAVLESSYTYLVMRRTPE